MGQGQGRPRAAQRDSREAAGRHCRVCDFSRGSVYIGVCVCTHKGFHCRYEIILKTRMVQTYKEKIIHHVLDEPSPRTLNLPVLHQSPPAVLAVNAFLCLSPPGGLRLSVPFQTVPLMFRGAQHILINRVTKLTWPALPENPASWKIWVTRSGHLLDFLVSQFSTLSWRLTACSLYLPSFASPRLGV